MIIKNKISQSEVVTSVLLILIVISAIFIVMSFIFPFIKNKLSEADCISVLDKIQISENSKYTCYEDTGNLRVQISFGDVNETIKSFVIEYGGGGNTKTVEIVNGNPGDDTKLCMFNDADCTKDIEFPGKNEQRTYLIIMEIGDPRPEVINVYPVLKSGKTCTSLNEITSIPNCE